MDRVVICQFQSAPPHGGRPPAFGGVYNEYLMKKDMSVDINEQNFYLYSFGLLSLLLLSGVRRSEDMTALPLIIVPIIVVAASAGLVTSFILKFIDVIAKVCVRVCCM